MNRCSPRRPMYAACATIPHGSSRWMLKFHSCTVGNCILGAKTVIGGALARSCCGGVSKDDGFTDGAGSCVGNPPATVLLMSGEFTQPAVIEVNAAAVVLKDVVQLWTRPGMRPAAAVTWNEEIVSNAMP